MAARAPNQSDRTADFYRIRDFKDLPLERRQVRKPKNQPRTGIVGYQGLPFTCQKDHGRTAAPLDNKIKILKDHEQLT
ncbi:hypothetical protein B6A10_07135 [Flavobacterium sp. L1I52]|uniref:Uncharacterized protein n=1 Tax=Flavobacterium pokkalii TaxID=1940408 RepID=A0ABR7UQN2_9FLAO|nr:hypothetical protein [Flavobacterium pokkalii]